MPEVIDEEHAVAAQLIKEDLARARDVEDLVQLGAYVRGQDPRTDAALDRFPKIESLLRQSSDEECSRQESIEALLSIETDSRKSPVRTLGATEGSFG